MPLQSIPFSGGPASYGQKTAAGVGSFLESIAETKLKQMHENQQMEKLKKAFPNMDPKAAAWLAGLPPKEQLEALGRMYEQEQEQPFTLESVTPEQKAQLREAISKPEVLRQLTEDQIQKIQRYLNPPQEQMAEQGQQQPAQHEEAINALEGISSALRNPFARELTREGETKIPGLASLVEAGKGFVKEPGKSQEAQSFPQRGKGTMGQVGPQEVNIPKQPTPTEPKERKTLLKPAKKGIEDVEREEKQQERIKKSNAPYTTLLNKRETAVQELLSPLKYMKEELDKGDVASGIKGKLVPQVLLGSSSQRFASASDDVAAGLTALQSGVQTISKIKFNRDRKPNLGQDRATQLQRTDDMLDMVSKIALEIDAKDYVIKQNGGKEPLSLDSKAREVYKKIHTVPPVPKWAEEGEEIDDPKRGIVWRVDGPILRFNGFIGE